MSGFTPVNQVRLTNVAYVRLNKAGKRFEIAAYRNKVLSWRNKIETDLDEVLQIDSVFTNVSKGMLASSKDLKEAFGTSDQKAICVQILDKGELQISEQERQSLTESVFLDIASIVCEKTVNPETNRPYTIAIIQSAMREVQYSVNVTKSSKSQALDVIRKLKSVMPIARASMVLRIICNSKEYDRIRIQVEGLAGIFISFSQHENNINPLIPTVHADLKIDPEIYRTVETLVAEYTHGKGRVEVVQLQAVASLKPSTENDKNPEKLITSEPIAAVVEHKENTTVLGVSPSFPETHSNGLKPEENQIISPTLVAVSDVKIVDRNPSLLTSHSNISSLRGGKYDGLNNKRRQQLAGKSGKNASKQDLEETLSEVLGSKKTKQIVADAALAVEEEIPQVDNIVNASSRRKQKKKQKKREVAEAEIAEAHPLVQVEGAAIDLITGETQTTTASEETDPRDGESNPREIQTEAEVRGELGARVAENFEGTEEDLNAVMELLLVDSDAESEEEEVALETPVSAEVRFAHSPMRGGKKGRRAGEGEGGESNGQGKKGKRSKRLEREEQEERKEKKRVYEEQKMRRLKASEGNGLTQDPGSGGVSPSIQSAGESQNPQTKKSCNTCGGSFEDNNEYRNHFRSDWHRHNLKLKMKGLPLIPSEQEFLQLDINELEF